MALVWVGDESTEFYYEFSPEEGQLIYEILGKLSVNDLKDRGFNEEQREKIQSLYYSF